VFKFLFDLEKGKTVRQNSISERLSKIDADYFQKIHECIYEQFSNIYTETERHKHNLIRANSTIVSDTVGKLMKGTNNTGKKTVKFSVAFDDSLPCELKTFTSSSYSSKDIALHEVALSHVKKRR
jgi:hypothetical protein